MQDIGTVGYMRLTMPESNTYSLLSSQSKTSSVEDARAVRNFAAFIITRKDVGLTYYPSETPATLMFVLNSIVSQMHPLATISTARCRFPGLLRWVREVILEARLS